MARFANADPARPDAASAHRHIATLARVMAGLCAVMIAGLALYLGLFAWLVAAFPERIGESLVAQGLSRAAWLAIGACWIAAQGFLFWGLWRGRGCFKRLADGELFAAGTIRDLRDFAIGLFVYKAISPIMFAVAAVAAHLEGVTLPPGTGLTLQDFGEGAFTLVSLGALVAITAVLAHATEIADDHAQIV